MENDLNYKYIVYITINNINNYIYVGVHKTLTPYEFDGYLGNGIYINRPNTYEKSKTKFQQAVKEFGPKSFVRKLINVFDNEEEAYLLEKDIVNPEFLSREDVYNMVLGGCFGWDNSIKVYQYDITGKYLNEYPTMLEASYSINRHYTAIGHAVSNKTKAGGFFWNTDKVDKIDLSNYFNPKNSRKNVYRYLKSGEYDNKYSNGRLAAEALGCCDKTIYNACILGNLVNNEYYFSYVKGVNYSSARTEYIKCMPVHKYDNSGYYICSYDTYIEAQNDNKNCNIIKSIKLKSPDKNGNIWGLVKLEYYNRPKLPVRKRKVGRFDLNGNLIETFNSATQAAKEYGSAVWHVLAGRSDTQKGFKFKYLS